MTQYTAGAVIVDLEAKLKEAERKALESSYKLGIAQEGNKRLREALVEIMNATLPAYMKTVAIYALKEPQPEPDIKITCFENSSVTDVMNAMNTLIPTKYKFISHDYRDGVHTLKYRRTT